MATKLSFNSKIFIVIAIIIAASVILAGSPQTAKFFQPKVGLPVQPVGHCIGNHTACSNIGLGLNASQASVICKAHGCNFTLATGCIGTPHQCNSFKTQSACQNETRYGCNWTSGFAIF